MWEYNHELYHHGIKGQRWGVRRFQNSDGSLTAEGREHYGYIGSIRNKKDYKNALRGAKSTFKYNKSFIDEKYDGTKSDKRSLKKYEKQVYKEGIKDIKDEYKQTTDYNVRKALKIGLASAGVALAMYGGYKLYKGGALDGFLKKGQSFTENELDNMGISTFKVDTFRPDKFVVEDPLLKMQRKINHEVAESIRKTGTHPLIEKIKNDTKSLEDFEFHRVARVDEKGQTSTIDLPVDKKGYADAFAKKMVSLTPNRKSKDYDYWYNYIMKKIQE